MRATWHLLTGEYPPLPGGVSDYTSQLARALADAGERVEVWTPGAFADREDGPVRVHLRPDAFGPRGIGAFARELNRTSSPRRLFIQYVPHAFGRRAMNPLPALFASTRRRDAVWVMFHEVAYPFREGKLRHELLAAVTHANAAVLGRSADRLFSSTSAWSARLRLLTGREATVLPVPSNLSTRVADESVEGARSELGGSAVVGHFSTYGEAIRRALDLTLPKLLRENPERRGVLLGRGADEYARELGRRVPGLDERLVARGGLGPDALAAHLAACDVLVQPYPDGVTTRRSTVMASLALGLAVVTNRGRLTEPEWSAAGAVALVDSPKELAAATEQLLVDAEARTRLGARAAEVYRTRYSLEHTVRVLLAAAAEEDRAR